MIGKHAFAVVLAALGIVVCISTSARAQVGKGLLDPNVAAEKELVTLPHMTPAIVKAKIGRAHV